MNRRVASEILVSYVAASLTLLILFGAMGTGVISASTYPVLKGIVVLMCFFQIVRILRLKTVGTIGRSVLVLGALLGPLALLFPVFAHEENAERGGVILGLMLAFFFTPSLRILAFLFWGKTLNAL